MIENDEVRIQVNESSRWSLDSPKIKVFFPNGIQDDLDIVPYSPDIEPGIQRRTALIAGNCNYLGRLHNDNMSSVAVTGCLEKRGDIAEVTILSQNSANTMFTVDFDGNTKAIKGRQFRDKGELMIDYI